MYIIFTGKSPFKGKGGDSETFEHISALKNLQIPEGIPYEARDLIEKLLKLDPKSRIGAENSSNDESTLSGIEELMAHPFFKGVDFNMIFHHKAPLDQT